MSRPIQHVDTSAPARILLHGIRQTQDMEQEQQARRVQQQQVAVQQGLDIARKLREQDAMQQKMDFNITEDLREQQKANQYFKESEARIAHSKVLDDKANRGAAPFHRGGPGGDFVDETATDVVLPSPTEESIPDEMAPGAQSDVEGIAENASPALPEESDSLLPPMDFKPAGKDASSTTAAAALRGKIAPAQKTPTYDDVFQKSMDSQLSIAEAEGLSRDEVTKLMPTYNRAAHQRAMQTEKAQKSNVPVMPIGWIANPDGTFSNPNGVKHKASASGMFLPIVAKETTTKTAKPSLTDATTYRTLAPILGDLGTASDELTAAGLNISELSKLSPDKSFGAIEEKLGREKALTLNHAAQVLQPSLGKKFKNAAEASTWVGAYEEKFPPTGGAVKPAATAAPTPAPAPAATPALPAKAEAAAVKALDLDTAKKFLSEAGGDKAKARQLAATAGFTF